MKFPCETIVYEKPGNLLLVTDNIFMTGRSNVRLRTRHPYILETLSADALSV